MLPNNGQASRKDEDPLCAITWLYLLGVAHALHVGRSNAGAGEGLSWVLPVAAQDLTLQVGAQRLNVVAPDGEKTERINVMQIVCFFLVKATVKLAKLLHPCQSLLRRCP